MLREVFHIKITEAEQTRRKELIIHNAFELFCQKGIDRVSIKEIAHKSGVGEMSIYRYFTSKTALLLATLEVEWEIVLNEITETIVQPKFYNEQSGYGQVALLLEGFRSLFDKHSPYILFSYDYKLYLIRNSSHLPVKLYKDEIKPLRNLFIHALSRGVQDGSIAMRENIEDMYLSIWGLMRGYVSKVCLFDNISDGENLWREHFELACKIILNGLKGAVPSEA